MEKYLTRLILKNPSEKPIPKLDTTSTDQTISDINRYTFSTDHEKYDWTKLLTFKTSDSESSTIYTHPREPNNVKGGW